MSLSTPQKSIISSMLRVVLLLLVVPGIYGFAVCLVCMQMKPGVPVFLAFLFGALAIYIALLRHRIFHHFEVLGF